VRPYLRGRAWMNPSFEKPGSSGDKSIAMRTRESHMTRHGDAATPAPGEATCGEENEGRVREGFWRETWQVRP